MVIKMKIAINNCHSGFGVSHKAFLKLREMGNKHALKEADIGEYYPDGTGPRKPFGNFENFGLDIPRNDLDLIHVIESMGIEANGSLSQLKIIEIPDDVEWQIEEYDGFEWIAEKHRTWS